MHAHPKSKLLAVLLAIAALPGAARSNPADEALANGEAAGEALGRCDRFVRGWLAHADPATGLIPRNLRDSSYWNGRDAAADNWPFMVLTTFFTDETLFHGRMKDMLATEQRLTSRIGRLPDDYDFKKRGWRRGTAQVPEIMFDAAEYMKDGLMPVTELLGPSPWSERMTGILDDMWQYAAVETPFGKIPSDNIEVQGDQLQTLARCWWLTGNERYRELAFRMADYFLLGTHHPTRDTHRLRLRDHGCEVIFGLCEVYVIAHFTAPEKKTAYRKPLYEMIDRVLEVGRNAHGMFFDEIDPVAGKPLTTRLADTWGYTLNGIYTVWMLDQHAPYREACIKPLGSLAAHYRNYPWEGTSQDGYADSIECAIDIYNVEPVPAAAAWIDSEMRVMWAKQQADGVIEGWHGDGNFARTSLMFALWKSQGACLRPWRSDVICGAVRDGDAVVVALRATTPWQGRLVFDRPRHREVMHLPLNYPRINQFPEWFVVESNASYSVTRGPTTTTMTGTALRDGLAMNLAAGERVSLRIKKASADGGGSQSPATAPGQGAVPRRFAIVENLSAKRLEVLVDGKPFTSYIYPDGLMKPVLYPIRTAEGAHITRGWPLDPRPGERIDHPHHVGMWLNFGDVNGLDFWNNSTAIPAEKKSRYGVIKHREVVRAVAGKDQAILEVALDWQKPDGTNLLREDTRFVFSGSASLRAIERITRLTALQEGVTFKDNKEGFMGIRVARELELPSNKPEILTDASGKASTIPTANQEGVSGNYRSSTGQAGEAVWGTRAQWVTLEGVIDRAPVSLAILDHPKNPGYPTFWHARGYGLFAANPLGQKLFSNGKEELNLKLAAGQSVSFRHKVLIHSGSHLTDAQLAAEFKRFAASP